MYLICDIDGTLAIVPPERAELAAKGDWARFYACDFAHDAPISQTIAMVEAWLEAGGILVVVTSRRDTVRDETWDWLRAQLPDMTAANTTLVMRKADDDRPETAWKVAAVRTVCPKPSACLVLDDNAGACAALASDGYTVLRVERGEA